MTADTTCCDLQGTRWWRVANGGVTGSLPSTAKDEGSFANDAASVWQALGARSGLD